MNSDVTIDNTPETFDSSPADYDLFKPLADALIDRYGIVGEVVPDNLMRISKGHPVVYMYRDGYGDISTEPCNIMKMLAQYLFDVAGSFINMDFEYYLDDWYDFPRFYTPADLIEKYEHLGKIPARYISVEKARNDVRMFAGQFMEAMKDLRFVYHHSRDAGAYGTARMTYKCFAFKDDQTMAYEVRNLESNLLSETVPLYVFEKKELISNRCGKIAKMCMLVTVKSDSNRTEIYKAKLERIPNEQKSGKVLTGYRQDLVTYGTVRSCNVYTGAFKKPGTCPNSAPCMMYRAMQQHNVACPDTIGPVDPGMFYDEYMKEAIREALQFEGHASWQCNGGDTYSGYDTVPFVKGGCAQQEWECINGHKHYFSLVSLPIDYTCTVCGERMPHDYFGGIRAQLNRYAMPIVKPYNKVLDTMDSAKKSKCGSYTVLLGVNGHTYRMFIPDSEDPRNPMEKSGGPYKPEGIPPAQVVTSNRTEVTQVGDDVYLCDLYVDKLVPVFPNTIRAPYSYEWGDNRVIIEPDFELYAEYISDACYGANTSCDIYDAYIAFDRVDMISYSNEDFDRKIIDCGQVEGNRQAYIPAGILYHTECPINVIRKCNSVVKSLKGAAIAEIDAGWKNGFTSSVSSGYRYAIRIHFFLEY